MRGTMMTNPLLLSRLIDHAAQHHGSTEFVSRLIDGTIERSNWSLMRDRSKRLANALTKVQGLRARHLANWRGLFDMACRGESPSRLERMRVRFEASDAAGSCFETFSDIWPHAGAAAVAESNPLQNAFRDLMAMRNHGSAGREAAAGMYIGALFDLPMPPIKGYDMGILAYYK